MTPADMMQADWAKQPERGGVRGVRAMLWLVLHLGARTSGLLIPPLALWFLATASAARRSSRDYLGCVLDRPVRLADVFRHFSSFGAAILDRVFLVTGRTAGFTISTEGLQHVAGPVERGQGCVLLGAHLGSFEVLRTLGEQSPVPVRALMFRRNAGPLTRQLERFNPELRDSVIDIGEPSGMLRVRECIARGEIVGILADRTPEAGPPGHRMVTVPFLGSPARFPAGPFILASMLDAPVVLFRGVRTGPRRYIIRFEPFADRVVLNRATRAADLRAVVARYAAALERGCRAYPLNWFNFFPFWENANDAESDPEPAADARALRTADRASAADAGRGRRIAAPHASA